MEIEGSPRNEMHRQRIARSLGARLAGWSRDGYYYKGGFIFIMVYILGIFIYGRMCVGRRGVVWKVRHRGLGVRNVWVRVRVIYNMSTWK